MQRSDTLEVDDIVEEQKEVQSWGKLTSLSPAYTNIELVENEYTMGRASSNTVVIHDKRLSSTHCKVTKDEEGKVYVTDLSSNGTFLENDKIGKGEKRELIPGDKFFLLHKSKVPAEDVLGFIFSFKGGDSTALQKQREEDAKILEEQKKQTEKQAKLVDDLGEEMKCCICIDYIYHCITLVPCLHNFCGACFSDWMKKSKSCPQCREDVTEAKKNSTINNIIEKFLDANPDKKRPKEEYEAMDKQNMITSDRFSLVDNKVIARKRRDYDEEDEDEDEEDEEDEEEEEEEEEIKCQECTTARPGDGYKCDQSNPVHINCANCYRPFPDRRNEFPQQCTICKQNFCNLYFQCRNGLFGNRLEEFEKHKVQPTMQPGILRGNRFEERALSDYLTQNSMTCIDMFQEFLREFVDKANFKYKVSRSIILHTTQNTETPIERKTPVCVNCFNNLVWFQVVFRYGQYIKPKLPPQIRDRAECWYGINCRTMIHKEDHARKLSHMCEQNKF